AAREGRAGVRLAEPRVEPLRLEGKRDLPVLLGVVGLVAAPVRSPWRELGMIGLALASIAFTPPVRRREYPLSFRPLAEVAIVFAGIFATMGPALELLRRSGGTLGLHGSAQFFW